MRASTQVRLEVGRSRRRGAQAGSRLEERAKPKPQRASSPLAAGRGPSNVTSGRTAGERSDVRQYVPLDWVSCGLGGERPWFLCHGLQNGRRCGRRVRYLLLRACLREPTGTGSATGLLKTQKIRDRIGSKASMPDDFPNKPRGMHWRTYDRLQKALRGRGRTIADDVDGVCRSIRRTLISAWIGLQSPAYHVLNCVRPTRTRTRGSCGPGSCQ
jgi:hypothetical protein